MIYLQNNHSEHKSHYALYFFAAKNIGQLESPVYSADLDTIEKFGEMSRWIANRREKNGNECSEEEKI